MSPWAVARLHFLSFVQAHDIVLVHPVGIVFCWHDFKIVMREDRKQLALTLTPRKGPGEAPDTARRLQELARPGTALVTKGVAAPADTRFELVQRRAKAWARE